MSELIIAGYIEVPANQRDSLVAAIAPHVESSRTEEGCLGYTLYVDPVEDNRIGVFEHWTSQDALLAHFEQPAFHAIRGILADVEGSETVVLKHMLASSGPVFE